MPTQTKLICRHQDCKHEWYAKVAGVRPQVCPRCKRYDWDESTKDGATGGQG